MTIVTRALWQIEMRLDGPLSLDELSQLAGASPYHLSRAFRTATGLSPMSYVRARRLTIAAHALAEGDEDILSIALAAQYGSHEAFTRAFAALFGRVPSQIRAERSTQTLSLMEPFEMRKDLLVDVDAPEIRERESFRVVGVGARCSFEDAGRIPALWQSFNSREDEVPDAVPGTAYGVCCDADAQGHFRYVAGIESSARALPEGMEALAIPAHKYAVFRHVGHVSDMPKTVYTIWNKALPDAGLTPAKAADFEVYDKRFDVPTGRGVVEIWIPVG